MVGIDHHRIPVVDIASYSGSNSSASLALASVMWANPFGEGFLGLAKEKDMKESVAAIDLFDLHWDDETTSPGTSLPERTIAECWEIYRSTNRSHTELSDQEIVAMLQSLVDAHKALKEIDPYYYAMAIDSIENRYYGYRDLELIAKARNIKGYSTL